MEKIYWLAVGLLSISFWFQIYKIHVHKEVRDISAPYYLFLLTGYIIMTFAAINEGSTIFMIKQIATAVPVAIILFQIWLHKDDTWNDQHEIVYEVVKYTYSLTDLSYSTIGLYRNLKDANKSKHELTVDNETPVKRDEYGPISGIEYKIQERELI